MLLFTLMRIGVLKIFAKFVLKPGNLWSHSRCLPVRTGDFGTSDSITEENWAVESR